MNVLGVGTPEEVKSEYERSCKYYYGVEPLSLEEEVQLPFFQYCVRATKIRAQDELAKISLMVESLQSYTRRIPELNDVKQARLVEEYRGHIKAAMRELDAANNVGKL